MRSASFPARLLDRCIRIGLSTAMFTAGLPAVATPIDFSGSAYTQDFQSMTGGAFNATTISVGNMLDVSTLAMSGSAAGVNGWYVYGGNATPRQGISNGSSSTGSFYQLIDGSGGRALGAQGSGNADWFFGVVLKNTSGATINNLTLAYDAVMNRNPASTVNAYPLSWLVSNATVASGSATGAGTFANGAGTWNTTTLGFSTPSSGTGAPGSQAAINPMFTIGSRSGNLTNMTWGADQYLYIRWNEKDEGGADATAGVDNFSLTPLAVNNLSWNVAGSGVWDTTTANWTTGSGATTFANGDQATFSNAAGGTITLSGALAPSTVVVSAASGTYTFSGPGAGDAISGAASLSKSNAGTLALTSVNTYAGGTSLSGGTLEIDGDGRLGSGGVTISGGATLRSTSATDFALANTLGIGSGGGTIDTGASNMSVAGVSSLSGVLTKAGSGSLTVSGAFSPGSGGGVSVAAGNLVLGNGPTASGVYNIGASGVLTGNLVLSGTQRMNVNDGANLSGAGQVQLATSGALLSNVSGNAGGTISAGIGLNSSAAPFTAGSWTGDVYTPGSFLATIGATQGPTGVAGTLTVNGTISGDSDLDLSNSSAAGGGGGVLTLGARNTYTGNTTINTGSPTIAGNANVVLGIDDAIPVTSGVIVGTKTGLGGSILDMNGFDQQVAYLADGANATVGTTKNLSIVNKGATASTLTLGGLTTPGKAFGGSIGGGTGTIDVVKTGANTQSLAGVNTYTGSTTIDQGTLALTGAGSLASPTIVDGCERRLHAREWPDPRRDRHRHRPRHHRRIDRSEHERHRHVHARGHDALRRRRARLPTLRRHRQRRQRLGSALDHRRSHSPRIGFVHDPAGERLERRRHVRQCDQLRELGERFVEDDDHGRESARLRCQPLLGRCQCVHQPARRGHLLGERQRARRHRSLSRLHPRQRRHLAGGQRHVVGDGGRLVDRHLGSGAHRRLQRSGRNGHRGWRGERQQRHPVRRRWLPTHRRHPDPRWRKRRGQHDLHRCRHCHDRLDDHRLQWPDEGGRRHARRHGGRDGQSDDDHERCPTGRLGRDDRIALRPGRDRCRRGARLRSLRGHELRR
jgi:autotransporter-associated beta strand protein